MLVSYKQENLIPNSIADKTINIYKWWSIIAGKKLNTTMNKVVNANKKQDIVVGK